jgi:rubrerythrin
MNRVADGDSRPTPGAAIELRCATCGYGVIVRVAPETCPMCDGGVWDYVAVVAADGRRRGRGP